MLTSSFECVWCRSNALEETISIPHAARNWNTREDFSETKFNFSRCSCGAWIQMPLPSEDFLAIEYERNYPAYETKHANLLGFLQRKMLEKRLKNSHLSRSLRVLDIGCGSGETLATLQKIHGWDFTLYATDIVDRRAAGAREISTFLELVDLPKYSSAFDLIIASQVVEHLASPLESLENWLDLLANDGQIWIDLPNVGFSNRTPRKGWGGWHAPYHLSFPTERRLEDALKGFDRAKDVTTRRRPAPFIEIETWMGRRGFPSRALSKLAGGHPFGMQSIVFLAIFIEVLRVKVFHRGTFANLDLTVTTA